MVLILSLALAVVGALHPQAPPTTESVQELGLASKQVTSPFFVRVSWTTTATYQGAKIEIEADWNAARIKRMAVINHTIGQVFQVMQQQTRAGKSVYFIRGMFPEETTGTTTLSVEAIDEKGQLVSIDNLVIQIQ